MVGPSSSAVVTRAPLSRWTVPVVALLVLVVDVVVTVAMWRWVDSALSDLDKRAAAHLDVLKLSASIAVGGGGLFALYLAARRQRTQELELEKRAEELAQRDRVQTHTEQVAETNRLHAEKVQAHAAQVAETTRVHAERVAAATERDAESRRVTDLYGKSIEQLGSDKAPVRHGGLYALERLAQDNPALRQTVANVLCAYLRAPFDPPGDLPGADADQVTRNRHQEAVQEREVRLAAQRILAIRMRHDDDSIFWPDIDLDLNGATLIKFNMDRCQMRRAQFDNTSFLGVASFNKAIFTGPALFEGATFAEGVSFEEATFADAVFYGTKFAMYGRFQKVTFTGRAFLNANFGGFASFNKAVFKRDAWFGKFLGLAAATFAKGASFDGTLFIDDVSFEDVKIDRPIGLMNALAAHPLSENSVWLTGWRPAQEYGPVDEQEGTWHHFVRVG